jgi:hypothetical protein
MTVGTTNTFTQNRNQIIDRAMATIGIKTTQRALTAFEVNQASDELNIMIKSWKTKDYLWKTTEGTLWLVPNQAKYRLDGSTANATENYTETTTSSSASIGATSITITSAIGFTIGNYIGIVQDDTTILWAVITNVVGTTITFTVPLTVAVASGNAIYTYQTKINRPEQVNSLRVRTSTNSDIPTVALARDSYFNIPVKTNSARPNQWYYDKQLAYGDIYLWPTPNSSSDSVKFTFQKMFFDIDGASTNADFPVEWLDPVVLNLALRLARIYGKDQNYREQLKRDADEAMANVQGYDREPASFYFQPASQLNVGTFR